MRETTMNVFEPINMYRRKSAAVRVCPVVVVVCVYVKKFVAAFCSPPATAVPRRIGSPAKMMGIRDSSRIAPLYRVMILIRALNTLPITPRDAPAPGLPRPKPLEIVSAATAPHRLLPDDPRVDRERPSRLRDEHVLEGDLLRPDLLHGRAVPRHGLDDPREHRAGVLHHHVELRAPAVLGGHHDVEDAGDRAQTGHRGLREDPR